jgi:hypothetical protein
MRVGTKSVLFGAHCFLLHWLFVAAAWWKLYGFPWDPRLWICFFVHDLGYLGKPNMDGPEGETHVEFGAKIMGLFGRKWRDFCLYHSRFYAKKHGANPSMLCIADKLAIVLTPPRLYLALGNLSGEIDEYLALSYERAAAGWPKFASMRLCTTEQERWYADVQEYLRRWVAEHKDGKCDTWTPSAGHVNGVAAVEGRATVGTSGVWQ